MITDDSSPSSGGLPARSLPTATLEAQLFQRNRRRIWRTTLRQMFRESFIRVLMVCLLTTVFWCVMYGLFHEGFELLQAAISHPPTLARTVHAVYNVFFLSLLVMLSVSSGILYYASIYRGPDMAFLLTLPARAERIATDRFVEATMLACWGLVLLGSPLLVAYGIVNGAPLAYFILCLPLLVSFAMIPAGVGATGCMLLVSVAPRFRRTVLGTLIAVSLAAMVYLVWAIFGSSPHGAMSSLWLQSTLGRLRVAEQRFLPSWWLSTGLLEAAHGGPRGVIQALGFQCVLLSHALLVHRLVGWAGQGLLRSSYGRMTNLPSLRLPWHMHWLDGVVDRLLHPLPVATRNLLSKDLRIFRRDPLQWSQFLLFFGLLSFYFIYVRRFDYGRQLTAWMTAIGFMNLGVVGLILSTFTTRFVFPLISMEGQRFWILGTAPINRREILWSKFLFAWMITGIPCCLLVFLSDVALQLWDRTPLMIALHQLLCICIGAGLSALSVGMGARLPNMKEGAPAKIAAGFGGTLTLILSALFVIAVVVPPAIPAYFLYAEPTLGQSTGMARNASAWLVVGLTVSSILTAVAIWFPLKIGVRAFQRLEPI